MPGSTHDPLRKIQAQHPPETKADIGSILKAARQKRAQSLEAVVSHTRIPKKFIEALEANRLEEFPALAYLRGFLKSYCDYLEVDFDVLWRLISPPAADSVPANASAADAAAHKTTPTTAPHDSTAHAGDGALATGVAALAVAGLIAVIAALALRGGKPKTEDAALPTMPAVLEPLRLQTSPDFTIEFLDEAWISIQSDGRTVFEGSVPKNSRQVWKAKRTISFRTNSPNALRLSLGGAKYALPAPDSQGAYRIDLP